MADNVWGSSDSHHAHSSSIRLNDVMGEELAAKLQKEEEEQWEEELAQRFGDNGAWCFVEVPCSEGGAMSVVQQKVPLPPRTESGEDDPDYIFALELQTQEAEEYDRLRRQEASSLERVKVIQQEPPRREVIQQTLDTYYDSDEDPRDTWSAKPKKTFRDLFVEDEVGLDKLPQIPRSRSRPSKKHNRRGSKTLEKKL